MSDDKLHKYIEANKEDKKSNSGNTATIAVLDKPKTKKPPLYRVIVLNDDYTPMEFVVYVLQAFFGFDRDKAQQIMLAIHTHGKGVCGIFTKEVAEKLPKLAIGGVDLIRKIGFNMVFGGPSMMGADLIPESVLNDMAQDLGVKEKEPMTFAGGGMAMMDDMIKPIGMAEGGMHPLVVFREMYDQYRLDNTDDEVMSFKEFFDMIQKQLNKEASS